MHHVISFMCAALGIELSLTKEKVLEYHVVVTFSS